MKAVIDIASIKDGSGEFRAVMRNVEKSSGEAVTSIIKDIQQSGRIAARRNWFGSLDKFAISPGIVIGYCKENRPDATFRPVHEWSKF